MKSMEFKTTLMTDGKGLWSNVVKEVKTTEIDVITREDPGEVPQWGELRVFFDTDTWNRDEDGLIYTDSKFEEMLKLALFAAGLTGVGVSYSEAGMQGDDYVSLDVSDEFMNVWRERNKDAVL